MLLRVGRRRSTAWLATAALMAGALGSLDAAGQDSEPAVAISLEEAVARALEGAPESVLGASEIAVAQASRVGATLRVAGRPHVQAEVRPNVDPQLPGGTAPGYAASAGIPLDLTRAPAARLEEADRRVDLAEAELAVIRMDVRLATIAAYVSYQLAEAHVRSAEDSLAIAARVSAATRERSDAGSSSEVDVAIAAHAVALGESELEEARAARAEARAALGALLDLSPGARLQLTTPVDRLPAVPGREALPVRAASAHPAVAALEARAALHGATLERLEREIAPTVGVYAGVDAAPASPVFGLVGLSVEMPLFQRNQGPRAIASAERETETRRADLRARALARDALALRDAYEARRASVDHLDERAVPLAERRLALVEEGFRLGRFDVFRVSVARDELNRTRNLRLAALAAAWQTWVALERALGGEP